MSSHCLICLELLEHSEAEGHYHGTCLSELFGTTRLPLIDADRASLPLSLWKMAGGVSISGMQPKLSMRLSADRSALETVEGGGEFILKPQSPKYMFLPENEHVTMRSALLAGIDIPPCGLVHLRDGSLAYIVRRYDRHIGDQVKLRQEDFCQLAQLPSQQKENGSAELCVRLMRKFVTVSPETELAKLYRRIAFAYLTGNGDLHLKNLSLVIGRDGIPRLSPAYDQVCTCLVIPGDQLTLSICGKRDRLNRETFMLFARYAGLTPEAAGSILSELSQSVPALLSLISASLLPVEFKTAYTAILARRAEALGKG